MYFSVPSRSAADAVTQDAGGLRLLPGATLSFDTYFNALFEHHWRLYTSVRRIRLVVRSSGACVVRLFRALPDARPVLLQEARIGAGADGATLVVPDEVTNFRQAGRLYFELAAGPAGATLRDAQWCADAETRPVGLALVFCTFNREADLARALKAIADDPVAAATVARVIVVNQGKAELHDHPAAAAQIDRLGARLHVLRQGNFGGAGGFGRGLLAAQEDPDVSHVAFIDDDVLIEPESLVRMARFFAVARPDIAVGGQMLDRVQPTRLYEAGAVIDRKWALKPLRHGRDLTSRAELDRLCAVEPMHYNGWWLFGFPLALVDDLGMPLSCFIRGDDVEFGLRLHQAGRFTVSLPGIAVWHEPFYLKIGNWQLYYETRNLLIAAALHLPFTGALAAELMGKRLLMDLLTFRYYNVRLILAGIEDFRRGPALLRQDPQPIHARLSAIRAAFPQETVPREAVLPAAPVAADPRGRLGFVAAMLGTLLRQWHVRTPAPPPGRLAVSDLVWFRVGRTDGVAVDTHWDRDLQVFRRDRATFRRLLAASARAVAALYREAPAQAEAWRRALPELSSARHWREYLRLSDAAAPAPPATARRAPALQP